MHAAPSVATDTSERDGASRPTAAPLTARLLRAGWTLVATSRRVQLVVLAVFVLGWVWRAVETYQDPSLGGLFRWIGIDFGWYLGQARAFAAGDIGALYSLDDLYRYQETLVTFTSDPHTALPAGHVPYPPIFAWLLSPLTMVSPPVAFAIWTLLGAAAAVALAGRVVRHLAPESKLLAATLLLVSTPLVFALWFGQIQIFLAIAFGEAFLALRRGRDLGAGLWLSVLLLKPQYLMLAIPLLAWKRRWRVLAGFGAGGLLVVGASAVVAGPASIIAYFGDLVETVTSTSATSLLAVAPEVMINWRALVLAVPLDVPGVVRTAITLILSGITVIVVLAAWRGPWQPTGPRFAARMTLLAIGTLLASYHSHAFGATMIAVPLAAYLAGISSSVARERIIDTGSKVVLACAIVVPWLWFAVLGRSHTSANSMLAAALVAGLFLLARLVLTKRSMPPDGALSPVQ